MEGGFADAEDMEAEPEWPGAHVLLKGLKGKPALNGREGVVHGSMDSESGRWDVHLYARDSAMAEIVKVRECNMEFASASHPQATPILNWGKFKVIGVGSLLTMPQAVCASSCTGW